MSSKTQAPVNTTSKPSLNADRSGLLKRQQRATQNDVIEVPPITHEFNADRGVLDNNSSLQQMPMIQAKLTIGESDDPLEREADRVADQVLAAPVNSTVSTAPHHIQRFTGQASGGAGMVAPASVESVLSSPGSPLEPGLQKDMGQRFGHDFSRVRVHTDAAAGRSARDVNANAYTVGDNIVFGAGRFVPGTHEGRRLIAHELTHVVQQSAEAGVLSPNHVISESGDIAEQEADSISDIVTHGKDIEHVSSASASGFIQREPSGPEELAGAAKKWLGRKYSAGKEAVYKGLISGLRKFQKMTFDTLRTQASRLPTSLQPALIIILNIWEEIFGVLITLLLAVVGIVVGFGEGIVDLVEGLVQMVWGIVKWFGFLILGFLDNGQKFEQYNKEIIAAASNIPDGLRALIHDWLDKFEKAPIDRGSLMIGELTGQIIAFIASFGVAAAKVGQVPKLMGELTIMASRGGELALVTVAMPAQTAAAAASAVALTSPTLMQAADKKTESMGSQSTSEAVEDLNRTNNAGNAQEAATIGTEVEMIEIQDWAAELSGKGYETFPRNRFGEAKIGNKRVSSFFTDQRARPDMVAINETTKTVIVGDVTGNPATRAKIPGQIGQAEGLHIEKTIEYAKQMKRQLPPGADYKVFAQDRHWQTGLKTKLIEIP
jgi:Domain of unknown function (DUF4157)